MNTAVEILAHDTRVLSHSRNLAGLRRAARKYSVSSVALDILESGRGLLSVAFSQNNYNGAYAGASCVTTFESFDVMCGWVSRWRSVSAARIYLAGMDRGPQEQCRKGLANIEAGKNYDGRTVQS